MGSKLAGGGRVLAKLVDECVDGVEMPFSLIPYSFHFLYSQHIKQTEIGKTLCIPSWSKLVHGSTSINLRFRVPRENELWFRIAQSVSQALAALCVTSLPPLPACTSALYVFVPSSLRLLPAALPQSNTCA